MTAFAMMLLVALGAVVVDLGFSWMLRRQEQNAADPGALAAARWIRDEADIGLRQSKMEAEACFYAQENGFFEGDSNCADALDDNRLEVNSPPTSSLSGNLIGTPDHVEVIIRDTHPSFFGQFFGRSEATVTTAAVAALTTGNANSSSLVALGTTCSGNEDRGDSAVSGGANVSIYPADGVTDPGGYVHVNAPCGSVMDPTKCDASGSAALSIGGGGTLTAPHTYVVGACAVNNGATYACTGPPPCLEEDYVPLGDPLADLPEPYPLLDGILSVPPCPAPTDVNSKADGEPCILSNQKCPDGVCTMSPGVYYAGWDIKSNVQVVMKPGMYVLAGFGIQIAAGSSLTAVADVAADGVTPIEARVTIFSTDGPNCATKPKQCAGSININSSGPLLLKATDQTSCQLVTPQICPWRNILLWQDNSTVKGAQDISIEGKADITLSGTIYGAESKVKITGNSDSAGCFEQAEDTGTNMDLACLSVQIIARQWELAGGANLEMPYDPAGLFILSQRGLVK